MSAKSLREVSSDADASVPKRDQQTSRKKASSETDLKLKSENATVSNPTEKAETTDQQKSNQCSSGQRLLLLSNKIKNHNIVDNSLLPNVRLVQYRYEAGTVDAIFNQIVQALNGSKVESVACILHTKPGNILLCTNGEEKEILSPSNVAEQNVVASFFKSLVTTFCEGGCEGTRFDLLACSGLRPSDIGHLAPALEKLLEVPVGISKEILGTDIVLRTTTDASASNSTETESFQCVGEMYFKTEKLKNWSPQPQTLAGFERIRTVGKGAYGAAVLYRKKDDDSLVILKEINMLDLSASERQMALNEIRVLSIFDHPNIISYYDSFEEDGTLMIEMEYADGGTLQQYLNSLQGKRELEEREILIMFLQMVAGIKHIHDHNILHRDMKTANVFLTKEGTVKIGDFGISKIMSSKNRGASTVLGTPYYISPEICEGKPYNEKSDIWALGCILYEMACLQKTFEGTNLPALVNKIMKGQFTPVKGNYSMEFKILVQDLLQREPEYRPSASELVLARLPSLMRPFEESTTTEDEQQPTENNANTRQKVRSVLYHFNICNLDVIPVELPAKIKVRQFAVSETHCVVVTFESDVYSWGEGRKGQLGHGNLESQVFPDVVQALRGKSIIRACCGDSFSVFGSDNGIVMTCGDGRKGCLGHGDWNSTSRPRLIEALLSVDVSSVSCGPQHVVAVGADGEVFAWGVGKDGRLGLGNEDDYCEPNELTLGQTFVRDVTCGVDGTMFLTDMGCLLACGSNENNKLALNNRQGFLMAMKNIFAKTEVEGRKVPTKIKPLASFRVVDMILGPHHSAVLVEPGVLYMFGRNTSGELGLGNTKPRGAPMQVRELSDRIITTVACGDGYTVAGTSANELFMWGRDHHATSQSSEGPDREFKVDDSEQRNTDPTAASDSELAADTASRTCENASSSDDRATKSAPPYGRQADGKESRFTFDEQALLSSSVERQQSVPQQSKKPTTSTSSIENLAIQENTQLLLQPRPVFMLGTSGNDEPYQMTLRSVLCQGEYILVHVETTCPPPRRSRRKKRMLSQKLSGQHLQVPKPLPHSANSGDGGDEYTSSEASEMDTGGSIPTWIKEELKVTDDNEEDDGTGDDDATETENDLTLASIKINKDINRVKGTNQTEKQKQNQGEEKSSMGVKKTDSSIEYKNSGSLNSPESGIQVTTDQLSSDSSCGDIQPNIKGHNANIQGALRKQGGSRPLNRIRAGRGRARTSSWTIDGGLREGKKPYPKYQEENLRLEFVRIKEENKRTLEELRLLEDKQVRQKKDIEAAQVAQESEQVLKQEIKNLRKELDVQSRRMGENNNLMLNLQEQIAKLQSDQLRSNARDKRIAHQKKSGASVSQSRVCLLS